MATIMKIFFVFCLREYLLQIFLHQNNNNTQKNSYLVKKEEVYWTLLLAITKKVIHE